MLKDERGKFYVTEDYFLFSEYSVPIVIYRISTQGIVILILCDVLDTRNHIYINYTSWILNKLQKKVFTQNIAY